MKRHFLQTLLLGLVALLCACGAKPQNGAPSAAPQDAPAAGEMRLLGPQTETGRYASGYRNGVSGRRILLWVDYDGAQCVPLCTAADCNHDTESCTAYLPDNLGFADLYAIDADWMLKSVTCLGQDARISNTLSLCRADGSDPRVLMERDTQSPFPTATDGESLWYTLTDDAQTGRLELLLYRLPLMGGDPVFVVGLGPFPAVLGCYGRSLVLFESLYPQPQWLPDATPETTDALQAAQDAQMQQEQVQYRVYFLDLDTGESRNFAAWQAPLEEYWTCCWQGDTLYRVCNGEGYTLQWQRPDGSAGGSTFTWPGMQVSSDPYLLGFAGDALLLDVQNAEAGCRLALDPTAGTARLLTLGYVNEYGNEIPLRILGQSENSLLVEFERQVSAAWEMQPIVTTRCGLITFEEYLAGIPNYREIALPYGSLQ